MEQYLQKSRLSVVLNAMGLYILLLLCGQGWFLLLWGAGMPSLLAGLALGLLLCMAVNRWRRRRADARAEAIRRRLGGELALEGLLMMTPAQAHCMAARWLATRYPLEIRSADDRGALCSCDGEALLVRCIAKPARCEAGIADAADLARACRQLHADRGVMCLACRADRRLAVYTEASPVPVRVIARETLLALAGRAAPATDEQLMALKLRREKRGSPGLLKLLVHPSKAKRYMGYGLSLMLMYMVTGVRFYPIPGAVCMGMAALCRCARSEEERL